MPLGQDGAAALERKNASLTAYVDKYEYFYENLEVDG